MKSEMRSNFIWLKEKADHGDSAVLGANESAEVLWEWCSNTFCLGFLFFFLLLQGFFTEILWSQNQAYFMSLPQEDSNPLFWKRRKLQFDPL